MKHLILSIILFSLLICNSYGSMGVDLIEFKEGHMLLEAMNRCSLVVVGRVSGIEYHYRENVTPAGNGILTTDVTVDVDELVKGTPNDGEKRVKFMVEGGVGTYPGSTKVLEYRITGEPIFELGERVFLFLANETPDTYFDRYPHEKYHVYYGCCGKRKIIEDKIGLLYFTEENSLKPVLFPLEPAVRLGKAFVKSKESSLALEEEIKSIVRTNEDTEVILSQELIDRLLSESKRILDKKEEN